MRSAVVVVFAVLLSGCIAVTLKGHAGVVRDGDGTAGQVGIDLGFGYAGDTSATVISGGVATGAPKLGIESGVDHVWLGKPRDDVHLGYRAGVGGVMPAGTGRGLVALRGAILAVVNDHKRTEGSGDGWFDVSSRLVVAFGLEGGVGLAGREEDDGSVHRSAAATAGVTLDVMMLSGM